MGATFSPLEVLAFAFVSLFAIVIEIGLYFLCTFCYNAFSRVKMSFILRPQEKGD